MIGPISAYGANSFISPYASYTAAPAASAEGISPAGKTDSAGQAGAASNQSPDAIRKGECPTCENRKYVDGSDEMVSFKTPTKINPRAAASSVRAHEQEHVSNAFAKASKMEGGKVLQASVTMKMGICPDCGRSYVAGGLTTTKIAYEKNNPYAENLKSAQKDALVGANYDASL